MTLKKVVTSAVKERRKFGNPLKQPKVKPFEVAVEFTSTMQRILNVIVPAKTEEEATAAAKELVKESVTSNLLNLSHQ